MFNVGGGEIFVILLVALIVLGPQRLPGAMRQAGQFMGELRKMSTGFQQELKSAFDETELMRSDPKPQSAPMAIAPGEASDSTDPEAPDGSAEDET